MVNLIREEKWNFLIYFSLGKSNFLFFSLCIGADAGGGGGRFPSEWRQFWGPQGVATLISWPARHGAPAVMLAARARAGGGGGHGGGDSGDLREGWRAWWASVWQGESTGGGG